MPADRSLRTRALRTLRLAGLAVAVGVLAGLSSAGFLASLDWVTRTREHHGWLLYLLPVSGMLVGVAYHYGGGRSVEGNNAILDEIHEPKAWIPRRMAPMVYLGTMVTHLFGGSAGREGTALQMAGSLTDGLSRLIHLGMHDRRPLLIAALAGGFGSVFGVPFAGVVFAFEVQSRRRPHVDAIIPAIVASFVGDLFVRWVGVKHTVFPHIGEPTMTVPLLGKLVLAGIAFGLTARVFIIAIHGLKALMARLVGWSPARPLLGGAAVILVTLAVGNRQYLGLSVPLIVKSLASGAGIVGAAFVIKLLLTALTVGSGFQGGEVTPLFVIGATLGVTLGRLLHAPIPLLAAVGFVAVFAGAANTPIACVVMGMERFAPGLMVPLAIGCGVSFVCSSGGSIYGGPRLHLHLHPAEAPESAAEGPQPAD